MNNDMNSEQPQAFIKGSSFLRRFGMLALGVGLGSVVVYLVSRALGGRREEASVGENVVDDRGTDQKKAARILRNLRDRAFDASDEKMAVALGRPVHEVTAWGVGQELIDDDVVMKARGIALNRGVYIE